MSGFIRRFTDFPSQAVLTAIESINIIDLPPPAAPQGEGVTAIALVGEFADMTYATAVDGTGLVTTMPDPVEIFSGQDLVNKVGGFDATLGAFGVSCGNGYVELRNKSFGRLVVVPVNLCSSAGVRFWRQLPTNKSATDPTPVVPVQAATIPGGYLFKDAAQVLERLKAGVRVSFTADIAYLSGVDGAVTNGAAAATNTLTSAGGGFTTIARPDDKTGVKVGDILVTGVVGSTAPQSTDAGTWRVVSITSDTVIVVQQLGGGNFAWTTTTTVLAWRLHPALTADSYGEGLLATQATFNQPVRPITNGAGTGASGTDGTWATGVVLAPVVAPAAISANSADPLSGLAGLVGPTTAVAYTAAVQRPNAPSAAGIDALYSAAFDALLDDSTPSSEVSHLWAARKSSTIRSLLKAHALNASQGATGRTVSIAPELNLPTISALTTVASATDPGSGANRDERVFYDWPPVLTFIPEAVGTIITCADGTTTADGILDITGDGFMASIMGNLAPERNPGESTGTTQRVLAPVLGYARGVPKLPMNAWILLRQRGVAGIRMDKDVGPVFQSGVTTSLVAGRINIARRKIADYLEDSLARIVKPFCKLPQSTQMQDGVLSEVTEFLDVMLSANNSAAQRIESYIVDEKSGNTPDLNAAGIYVIIVKVRTLASADFIVIQCEIGENVVTTAEVPVAA